MVFNLRVHAFVGTFGLAVKRSYSSIKKVPYVSRTRSSMSSLVSTSSKVCLSRSLFSFPPSISFFRCLTSRDLDVSSDFLTSIDSVGKILKQRRISRKHAAPQPGLLKRNSMTKRQMYLQNWNSTTEKKGDKIVWHNVCCQAVYMYTQFEDFFQWKS